MRLPRAVSKAAVLSLTQTLRVSSAPSSSSQPFEFGYALMSHALVQCPARQSELRPPRENHARWRKARISVVAFQQTP
jgi:hypothetical protein